MGHSSHVVKVGVEATCLHFNPWRIPSGKAEQTVPFGTMNCVPMQVNNSISFANGSKSIVRSNSGLCKPSEIYLI